ncbi:hypothetical protein LTR05_008506 [Lithohypha guttulata]|uniref:RING-type domain-containing protein n=1 Tax=Lithohypha guttulata TaxID=1690604 RepID=A0AAN7SLD3_9EURO|nr:hypothetical protein LTR05_008506 [Lithohypha guttulata]
MSASSLQIVTIIVPNPQYDRSKTATVLNSNLSFGLRIPNAFITLSNNNPNRFSAIEGLLYVPTLPDSANGTCATAQTIVPSNVTTLASFPSDQNYPLVAIFPWTESASCTQAYLAQARADAVRAAFTFQPAGPDLSQATNSWNLNDTWSWKNENQYPIYAVAGATGAQILDQMALYSGSLTDAPNGATLAQQNDPRDFPRLFAHVDLQNSANVPSLWIFLIIVLAILLGIVIFASLIMHLIQRHQRRVLQRRLERGEVDLESLGIKKMNVPQHKIDEMPKYTYSESNTLSEIPIATIAGNRSSAGPTTNSFSQPTCAICLEDFIVGETMVRELPCKHIFHPECIDLFLRDNSSLCPMCKKSALPAGYCPVKVTNLMVRRERLIRRMRDRRRQGLAAAAAAGAGAGAGAEEPLQQPSRAQQAGSWLQNRLRHPTTAPAQSTTPEHAPPQQVSVPSANDVELGRMPSTSDPTSRQTPTNVANRNTMVMPPEIASQGAAARRAWRRERLARQQDEQYNHDAENARRVDEGRPLWRRVLGRVAPGFD